MRNLFLAGALMVSVSSVACDVCGCASMAFGFDDLNALDRHSLGFRYGLRQFNAPGLTDYYHQTEVNALYSLNPKWQIKASLPYLYAQRDQNAEESITLNGLGDATLKLRYTPYYKIGEKAVQSLSFGIGLNMPTGNFENREGSLIAPNFQTGTGSWDVLMESRYQLSLKKWKMGFQAAYLFNNENIYDYTFGDQLMVQASFGRAVEIGKKSLIIPNLALSYEHFARDVNSRDYYQHGTGGEALNMLAGLSHVMENWYFTAKGGSNVFNESAGSYKPAFQMQLSLNYLF